MSQLMSTMIVGVSFLYDPPQMVFDLLSNVEHGVDLLKKRLNVF